MFHVEHKKESEVKNYAKNNKNTDKRRARSKSF